MYELSRAYFISFKEAIEDLDRIKVKYSIDFSRETDNITEKKFYFEVLNNIQRLEKVFEANVREGFGSYCTKLRDIGCVTRDEFYKYPWRTKRFTGLITQQMLEAATKPNVDFGVFIVSDILNFRSAYYDNIKEYTTHIFMGKKLENSRIEMWLNVNKVRRESKDMVKGVDIPVEDTKKKKKKKN